MTLICKNTCLNPVYEHKKTVRHIAETDYKKCSKCCVFIKWEGLYCPCCGVRLSNRAKNNKARQDRVYGNFTTL
jgi:hypothetical protein